MLIRLVVENVFSFGEQREFNMIPYSRLNTLNEHKYKLGSFEVLKMASIYGANGAGKSNLVKSLDYLQKLVIRESVPSNYKTSAFKFNTGASAKPQLLAVEFIQEGQAYYYGLALEGGEVAVEELYASGLGKEEDQLIFERKTTEGKTTLRFLADFEQDAKSQVLKAVLLEEFIRPQETVFQLLANRDNPFLKPVKMSYRWFEDTLQIITPESKPRALAHRIDKEATFKRYAEDLMRSFNIGIESLTTEKHDIQTFFGEDNAHELERLVQQVEATPHKMLGLNTLKGEELVIVKEDGNIWVKRLKVGHSGQGRQVIDFDLEEESDGTIRLLDFVPAFQSVISAPKVFMIDEIERSIHPLLIKELVGKFSADTATQGQLVFTTHESNLLDQKIFRQDEIWFVEKDSHGSTDLYPLSDFKTHKTIDIRKGYLNGRYGSIPFLGDLKALNWQDYVTHPTTI